MCRSWKLRTHTISKFQQTKAAVKAARPHTESREWIWAMSQKKATGNESWNRWDRYLILWPEREQSRERKRRQSAHGGNKLLAAAELLCPLSLVSFPPRRTTGSNQSACAAVLLLFSNRYFLVFSAATADPTRLVNVSCCQVQKQNASSSSNILNICIYFCIIITNKNLLKIKKKDRLH